MSLRDERRAEREREEQEREAKEFVAVQSRLALVWGVPERAKMEYIILEDAFGEARARVILDFIKALYGEPSE